MLVERQPIRLVIELLEPRIEPVWKLVIELPDSLRRFDGIFALHRRANNCGLIPLGKFRGCSARSGSTTSGLMRDSHGDALVECSSNESGFAQSRMARDNDTIAVDVRRGDEV